MEINLKCQAVQTTEKNGTVRFMDTEAGKQPEPGKPITQPSAVVMFNFTDPAKASQFMPGKIYSFTVKEAQ